MIRGNRTFAGLLLVLLGVGALSGAAAIADEGVDEVVQQTEVLEEVAVLEPVEVEGEEVEASPTAEEPTEAVSEVDGVEAESEEAAADVDVESADPGREPRPRSARSRYTGASAAAAASSSSAQPDGQGTVEYDPASAAGMCPGTVMKIDGLRSNGVFGPITISNYTNTSFTWTSTEAVSAVLVKDGGGHKTNPGGTSGSASTFGQDISHVIFCLGGEEPEVDVEEPCDADATMPGTQPCEPPPCDGDATMPGTQPCEPEPCDADATMPGTQPCEPEPCDGDATMPGTQPCEAAVCDGDTAMPGTQPCVPEPCDADEAMPGDQPCVPVPCDADETMPGRQDCTEGVAGVESDPKKEKPEDDPDDRVQDAGLAKDRAPSVAPMAAQPVVQGSVLPFTGAPLSAFVMLAFGLVTAGGGAVLLKRP